MPGSSCGRKLETNPSTVPGPGHLSRRYLFRPQAVSEGLLDRAERPVSASLFSLMNTTHVDAYNEHFDLAQHFSLRYTSTLIVCAPPTWTHRACSLRCDARCFTWVRGRATACTEACFPAVSRPTTLISVFIVTSNYLPGLRDSFRSGCVYIFATKVRANAAAGQGLPSSTLSSRGDTIQLLSTYDWLHK